MIKFNQLTFKNFINSGNVETVYNFNPGLTRIEGVSGVGKSTIIDAFYFSLTGEAFRDIKINELVSWVNETNCKVTLSFTKQSDEYLITRTLKDDVEDIFKIEKNGELIPMDKKKRSYQDIVYDILGIDKHYIEIGLIKSNIRDMSFLSMKKSERIDFGEKFFKMDIISQVESLLKIDLDEMKVSSNRIENNIRESQQFKIILENKIEQLKKLIEESKTIQLTEKQNRLVEIREELEKNEKGVLIVQKIIKANQEIEDEYRRFKKEVDSINSDYNKHFNTLSLEENKKKIFEDTCPECMKIESIFSGNLDDLKKNIETLSLSKKEKETKLTELNSKIQTNQQYLQKKTLIEANLRRLNSEMTDCKGAIEKIQKTHEEIDDSEVKTLEDKLLSLNEEKEELIKKNKIYTDLKKLMNPMKIYIIKKRLLFLNIKINEYMKRFNLPFTLIFDEKFDPKLYFGKGKTKNYHSISEGQKRRINLSLTFAFSDLSLELSHSTFNVQFNDEIFDNIDIANIEIILEIMREKVETNNMEIIFISHNGNFNNHKTDRRFLITNENGFGKLEEVI